MSELFTNPVSDTDCAACCSSLITDSTQLSACQNIGCKSFTNCFNNAATQVSCLNGRDFRFQGSSRVAGTNFRCSAGGITTALGNNIFTGVVPISKDIPDAVEINCSACCDSLDSTLDSSTINIFQGNQCRSVCGGVKNCVDEGDSANRLACFIASDFLVFGVSQYALDTSLQKVDPFNIQCLNGVFSIVDDNNGGGDDGGDGDNGGGDNGGGGGENNTGGENNDGNNNLLLIGGGVGAFIAVLISLVILFIVKFSSAKTRRKYSVDKPLTNKKYDVSPLFAEEEQKKSESSPSKTSSSGKQTPPPKPSTPPLRSPLNFLAKLRKGSDIDLEIPGLTTSPKLRTKPRGGEPSGIQPPKRSTDNTTAERTKNLQNLSSFKTVSTVATTLQAQGPNIMFASPKNQVVLKSNPNAQMKQVNLSPLQDGESFEDDDENDLADEFRVSTDTPLVSPQSTRPPIKRGRNFHKGKYLEQEQDSLPEF